MNNINEAEAIIRNCDSRLHGLYRRKLVKGEDVQKEIDDWTNFKCNIERLIYDYVDDVKVRLESNKSENDINFHFKNSDFLKNIINDKKDNQIGS